MPKIFSLIFGNFFSKAPIIIKDEGVEITDAVSSMDFVGPGVSATATGSDVTITVTSATNSFTTMQPMTGTTPVADSNADTLSFLSTDNFVNIVGDSVADSLDFQQGTGFKATTRALFGATGSLTYDVSSGVFGTTNISSGFTLSAAAPATYNAVTSTVGVSLTVSNPLTYNGTGMIGISLAANAPVYVNTTTGIFGVSLLAVSPLTYDNNGKFSINLGSTNGITYDGAGVFGTTGLPVGYSLNVTAPLTYNASNRTIGITVANTTTDGYLSHTDWNTFNSKEPAIPNGTTLQYVTGLKVLRTFSTDVYSLLGSTNFITYDGAGIFGTTNLPVGYSLNVASPITYNAATRTIGLSLNVSAPITYDGVAALGITVATTTTSGYLSSTDWNTFNNKEPAIATGTTLQYVTGLKVLRNFATDVRAAIGATSLITYDQSSGVFGTTNLPVGYSLNVATPITYNAATRTIGLSLVVSAPLIYDGAAALGITVANTTTSGYLTSTDWNTFNSKEPAIATGTTLQYVTGLKVLRTFSTDVYALLGATQFITYNGSGVFGTTNLPVGYSLNVATPITYNASNRTIGLSLVVSAPLTYDGAAALGITVATTSVDGYLSHTDWTTFNNKEPAIATGTTLQYVTGLKVLRTFNTDVRNALGSTNLITYDATNGVFGTTNMPVGYSLNVSAPATYNAATRTIGVSLTVGAPLSYDGNGAFGITVATTTVNGYLSSTDWTTFNLRVSRIRLEVLG